jgi:hypothetical protein
MRLDKKGSMFIFIATILLIFVILPIAYVASNAKVLQFDQKLGEKPATLLKTYEKGEVILYYIDESARHSLINSLYELAYSGGRATGCGSYEGYTMWNSPDRNCYPVFIHTLAIADVKNRLQQRITAFPQENIQMPDYDMVLSTGGRTELIGKTDQKIRMEISAGSRLGLDTVDKDECAGRCGGPCGDCPDGKDCVSGRCVDPGQPGQPSEGKCGYVVDYAKQYLRCPYSWWIVAILNPQNCANPGLTCATFVQSVFHFTNNERPRGNGNALCSHSVFTYRFKELSELRPGDVFSGSWGLYGHTGMYVGRGYVQDKYWWSCHLKYVPDPKGDYVFIHSVGNAVNSGGVCYTTHKEMFKEYGGFYGLIDFCRHKNCV